MSGPFGGFPPPYPPAGDPKPRPEDLLRVAIENLESAVTGLESGFEKSLVMAHLRAAEEIVGLVRKEHLK